MDKLGTQFLSIEMFGVRVNLIEIFLFSFLLLWVPGILANSGIKIRVSNSKFFNVIFFSLLGYVSCVLLSYFAATNEARVIKAWLKWLSIFIFSILIFLYVHNLKNFKKVYWILWLSNFGLILSVFLGTIFFNQSIFDYRIFPGYASAVALALLLPFANFKNKPALILAIVCFFSAAISLSRGVWLMLIVYSIIVFKNHFSSTKVWAIGLTAALTLIMLLFTPFGELILTRLTSTEGSNSDRIKLAILALQAFQSSPLIGIGSLNFPNFLMSHGGIVIWKGWHDTMEPHNVFLQVAAEEGIFALLCFVIIFGALYYVIFRGVRSKSVAQNFRPYLLGMKYLTIPITFNLVFGVISDQMRFIYCVFIGLTLAILRITCQSLDGKCRRTKQ